MDVAAALDVVRGQRHEQRDVLTTALVELVKHWLAQESKRTWVGSARGIIDNLERLEPNVAGILQEEDVQNAISQLLEEGVLFALQSEDRALHGSPQLYINRPWLASE